MVYNPFLNQTIRGSNLLKLYKQTESGLQYWEAWEDEDKIVTHRGALGETGVTVEIPLGASEVADLLIERESKPHRANGFEELEPLAELVVQYRCDDWGSPEDLDKRHKVEDLMNECLGWTGNGHCDGGDIGSGTINIFCYVVDPEIAARTTIECLGEENLLDLEGTIIAIRENIEQEVEKYLVRWPENFEGEFFPC